jgi:hypothetical protein
MSGATASPEARSSLVRLPGGIWALGFVSLFMDISSEMIHGLLPVFLPKGLLLAEMPHTLLSFGIYLTCLA